MEWRQDGPGLAAIAERFTGAISGGGIPSIVDTFSYVQKQQNRHAHPATSLRQLIVSCVACVRSRCSLTAASLSAQHRINGWSCTLQKSFGRGCGGACGGCGGAGSTSFDRMQHMICAVQN
eukprot:3476468-Rhodomonas_salina.1